MATGPGYPGNLNAYIPNWAASGRLAAAFSRNPKTFPLPNYIQMIESPKNQGYYLKLTAQEAARVASVNDYLWNWGAEAPESPDGLESFDYVSFLTSRYKNGFFLDDDTERTAEWDIAEQHAKIHAQKAMTIRANLVHSVLTNANNWKTNANSGLQDQTSDLTQDHTGTASAYAGGYLDQGTSTSPYIKIFLDKARVLIDQDSLGTVQSDQVQVVMNPRTARLLAESAEIHDYLKGSPDAMHEIRTGSSPNAKYGPGLPSAIYGVGIVVDNTVIVTSRKGATLAKGYSFPDQTIAVVSRVGDLEGVYGTPTWSTLVWMWYRDEMTLERRQDAENRRIKYRVVQCGVPILTSPITGYLLTSATSVTGQ